MNSNNFPKNDFLRKSREISSLAKMSGKSKAVEKKSAKGKGKKPAESKGKKPDPVSVLVDKLFAKLEDSLSEDADHDEVKAMLTKELASVAKPKKARKAKAKKDPDAPKKPKGAYFVWADEHREEVKGEGFTGRDAQTELARRWKELSEEEQKPYKDDVAAKMPAYKEAKAAWDEDHPAEESEDASDSEGKKKKKRAKKDPNAPKQAPNAYMLWCKERRSQSDEKLGAAVLGEEWRELDDDEKAEWKEKAAEGAKAAKKAKAEYEGKKEKGEKKEEKVEKKKEKKGEESDDDTPPPPKKTKKKASVKEEVGEPGEEDAPPAPKPKRKT